MPGSIRKDIQLAVDQYLNLYQEYKKLKDELDELKGVIEPYMNETGFTCISGTDGQGRVELTEQDRPVMNARYTTYDINEISNLLQPSVRKKCIVEVVDKEKLEALHKLGEVPADVLSRKITRKSNSFITRLAAK